MNRCLVAVLVLIGWPYAALGEPMDPHSLCMPRGPAPKAGYQGYHEAANAPGQQVISGVPGYVWRDGCGPTAAGMVVGYWDGAGFGALIPGDASSQTLAVNQAMASDGHYADYSTPLDYAPDPIQPDKSEAPPGDEHASDSVADFMETSFSSLDLYYGWSYYSRVDNALRGYTQYVNTTYGADYQYESWNESWGTFTWDRFVDEIDANSPLVFLVDSDGDGGTDHFVTAIGYRDTQGYPEYACLDTWDPAGQIRWERFRERAAGNEWGIHGATYFHITPEPASVCLLLAGGLFLLWRR